MINTVTLAVTVASVSEVMATYVQKQRPFVKGMLDLCGKNGAHGLIPFYAFGLVMAKKFQQFGRPGMHCIVQGKLITAVHDKETGKGVIVIDVQDAFFDSFVADKKFSYEMTAEIKRNVMAKAKQKKGETVNPNPDEAEVQVDSSVLEEI